MATRFNIKPDLQQIKQFEAVSGRPVTQQAIQGITQQAIRTAASRAEASRGLDLRQTSIENQKAFQNSQISLQGRRVNLAEEQAAFNNAFQDKAFAASQAQQALSNRFRQSESQKRDQRFQSDSQFRQSESQKRDQRFQQSFLETQKQNEVNRQNLARQLGIQEKEIEARIANQSELIGIKQEELKLFAERSQLDFGTLKLNQEAQQFNLDFARRQEERADVDRLQQQRDLKEAKKLEMALLAEDFKQQAIDNIRQSGGFSFFRNQQVADIQAQPAENFLPRSLGGSA